MTVHELNREQISQLKIAYLIELADCGERPAPSWGEIADADELVSDEEIFERFDDASFVEEDFGCGPLPGIDF